MSSIADWLLYAEDDLKTAKAALSQNIVTTACLHSHQTVEKSLKAVLFAKEGKVPKTHDLQYLLERASTYIPDLSKFKEPSQFLNRFHLPMRYPDALPAGTPENLPTPEDTHKAIEQAESILVFVKPLLQK